MNVNDESMNKSITSGSTDEVRAKLIKHLEIYKANVASQEEEIKHMDELYQDLVDTVLNVSLLSIILLNFDHFDQFYQIYQFCHSNDVINFVLRMILSIN